MNKQELNMKAARMCGWSDDEIDNAPFDLDTSAADREATVIALGEKYGSYIAYTGTWEAYNMEDEQLTEDCATYKEALLAAVEAAPDGGEG